MGELADILPELEPLLGAPEGPAVALEGGITNRNFRVTLGGHRYVVRRPGRDTALLGIDRASERIAASAAAEAGIAPPVAASVGDCLITGFVDCRAPSRAELREAVGELAGALRAFHHCGVRLPSSFWVPQLLERYAEIVAGRGGRLPPAYAATVTAAQRIAGALPLAARLPCHNDLLPGNLVRLEPSGRLLIVDWEYAGMGDPRFDLGNLSVNNDFSEAMDEQLLRAYHGAGVDDGVRAAHALMRIMSDAREAAWAVVQASISNLEFDFDEYGREHFERLSAAVADTRFEEWLEAARGGDGGQAA